METHETKVWPIDLDDIGIGYYLSPEDVAETFGTTLGTDKHRLVVLGLKSVIEAKMAARGQHVSVSCEGGGIRVRTNLEASAYSASQFALRVRQMGKLVRFMGRIDTSEFTPEQLQRHDRNLHISACTFAGAVKARRQAKLSPKPEGIPKVLSGS